MDLPIVLVLLFGATTLALEAASMLRGALTRRLKTAAAADNSFVLAGVAAPNEQGPARGAVAPPPAHVVQPGMASYVDPAAATMRRPAELAADPSAPETAVELAERWAWVDEARWADPDGPTLAGVTPSLGGQAS